jgi:SAM-dependent methyltransferase
VEFLRTTHEKAVAARFLAATLPAWLCDERATTRRAFEVGIGALQIGVVSFLPDVKQWDLVGLEPQGSVEPRLGPILDAAVHAARLLPYAHVVGRGEEAPFADGVFDLVVCYNVLEHVESPESVVGEMRRLVKSDGVALLGENCLSLAGYARKRYLYGDTDVNHPHAFTLGKLRGLVARCGFSIEATDAVPREWLWAVLGRFRKRLIAARPI